MKKYKAIFFDWDGTAVVNRKAPVEKTVDAMRKLLSSGVYLFVISGTTYSNIGDGNIEKRFTNEQLKFLFFGLARGSHNFGFDNNGRLVTIEDYGIERDTVLKIHDVAYDIHRTLFLDYGYNTDIVFDRPNYVKIDIMTASSRMTNMYLSGNEIDDIKKNLKKHGYNEGLAGLIKLAKETGQKHGLNIKATCDAKYLEVGVLDKSDNVDAFIRHVLVPNGISMKECCFWGDEYLELDSGITGSDSFMYTEMSKDGDFFDVGTVPGIRPEYVEYLGGSVDTFLHFLDDQSKLWCEK
ncbi:MAG: hypothetical protein BWY11_00107 [Firmicutes bacterium ADurb.Bin182]|nr:MAG: hypothetical protein BWY11_00107 [Firmicutes bacterium ADurb.Bin182]